MDQMNWTTRWETWRKLMGAPSSRQRRQINEFLRTRPCLLYWGDSWFSTPLYLNLARQSILGIEGMAMLVGKPGASAAELFGASRIRTMAGRIAASPFDVLCISAGGNDQLSGQLRSAFPDWMPPRRRAKLDADAAFEHLRAQGGFERLHGRYAALLDGLAAVRRARPSFRVLAHGYAPIIRIGAKADLTVANAGLIAWLAGDLGPWLWAPMQHVLADHDQARRFAHRLLVDGMRDSVLAPLAAHRDYRGFFHHVDFSELPAARKDGFWYDEIHPTEAGFGALAMCFNARLRELLPTAKQDAVKG